MARSIRSARLQSLLDARLLDARLLDQWFGIDLRSAALLRIALAAAILWDTTQRLSERVAFYTEQGVLPANTLLAIWGRRTYLSPLFHLSPYPEAIALFFGALMLASIAFGLGYRTRASGFLCWLLLVSIQIRNPLAAAEGCDKFLPQMLLLAVLLPLGARWSLDARRRPVPQTATRTLSAASAAVILQLCVLYWVTGWMKTGDTWRDGTAVYYALNLDYWVLPFGVWLRDHATATMLATWGTLWLERLGPLLAFTPIAVGPVRTALAAVFFVFHLSLASALNVGPFPIYTLVAWPALLPAWFWDVLLPRVSARARRLAAAPPRRENLPAPLAVQIAASALLALMFVQGLVYTSVVVVDGRSAFARGLDQLGRVLRFNQNWKMFTPDPPPRDVWPVLIGQLADGRLVDALNGGPAMLEKPELLSAAFPSFRWRLYLRFLVQGAKNPQLGPPLIHGLLVYACNHWNDSRTDEPPLRHVTLQFWGEPTDAPQEIERAFVDEHACESRG